MADTVQPMFIIDELRAKTNDLVLQAQISLPQQVSERLAKDIIAEREQLLFEGVKKYDELRKDVSKSGRPDATTQQRKPDGTWEKIEQFTDSAVKKLREAEKRLTEFKSAYLKALDKEKPDYEPLKKALKAGGDKGSDKGGQPGAPAEEPASD